MNKAAQRDRSADASQKARIGEMRRMLREEMRRIDDPVDFDAAEWKAV